MNAKIIYLKMVLEIPHWNKIAYFTTMVVPITQSKMYKQIISDPKFLERIILDQEGDGSYGVDSCKETFYNQECITYCDKCYTYCTE